MQLDSLKSMGFVFVIIPYVFKNTLGPPFGPPSQTILVTIIPEQPSMQ